MSFSVAYSADIDTPEDFNKFLNSCTPAERIQMMQALQDLPSNYNVISPARVLIDFDNGKLDKYEISPEKIRKALVWRAYNKMTYIFRGDDEVDYHGILQWAAGKLGVDSKVITNSSTYALEKEVAEKYFEKLWERLTPKQREELLKDIVKDEHQRRELAKTRTFTVAGILVAGSLSALSFPVLFSSIATSAAASGPFAPLVLLGGGIYLSWNEVDTVSAFIMTVNMIKQRREAVGR